MRHIVLMALVIFAVPVLGLAQVPKSDAKKETKPLTEAEQAVIKLDRDLMDAMVRGDMALGRKVEVENFVFINPGGGVEEYVASPSGSGPKFEMANTEKVKVRITGDTAVLTGKATIKGKLANGTDISGPYRYMRVFVKQQGEWRLVAASAVPIPPPPATTAAPKS